MQIFNENYQLSKLIAVTILIISLSNLNAFALDSAQTLPSGVAIDKFGEIKQMQSTITTQKLELHKDGFPSEVLTHKLELHRFFVPAEWQTGKLELHRQPSLLMPLSTRKMPNLVSPSVTLSAPVGSLSTPNTTAAQLPKPAEGNTLIKPITQTAQPEEINKTNPANSLMKPIRINPKNLNVN